MQKPSLSLIIATLALGVAAMAWMRNPAAPVTAPDSQPPTMRTSAQISAPAFSPGGSNSIRRSFDKAVNDVSPERELAQPTTTLPTRTAGISAVHATASQPAYQPSIQTGSQAPASAITSSSSTPVAAPRYQSGPMTGAGNAPAVAVAMPPLTGGAGAGGAVVAPLAMELDRGVQLPAAMVQTGDPMTPAQAAAKQQITDSFARAINNAAANSAGDPSAVPSAWSQAQADANARYHLLYGDTAYNRASVAAGIEAVSP